MRRNLGENSLSPPTKWAIGAKLTKFLVNTRLYYSQWLLCSPLVKCFYLKVITSIIVGFLAMHFSEIFLTQRQENPTVNAFWVSSPGAVLGLGVFYRVRLYWVTWLLCHAQRIPEEDSRKKPRTRRAFIEHSIKGVVQSHQPVPASSQRETSRSHNSLLLCLSLCLF